MVCSKCGAILKKGKVYCSRCGQEAQIVSDVNILEDDLLREMMDDQDSQEVKEGGRSSSGNKKKKDGNRKRETKKKQKKIRRNLIVCIVVLVVAAAAVLGIIKYNQNHSVGYLMKKAGEANSQKDYKTALDYLDRVLLLDEDNAAALLMAGEINTAMKDYDTAEKQLLTVLEMDASCPEAYQYLITIYEAQGQKGKILALAEDISDEEILALFEDYIVPVPEINMESGSYSDFFTVEITAPKRNLKIYYTLDGTTPTKEDTLYEEPVEISEQGETVLSAVCMDKEGKYSETVVAEYEIELDKPDMPKVSPDGGRFSMPSTVTVTVPEGATVYYTWDGSAPGKDSSKYTGPINIPEGNNILSLVAIGSNGMKSEVLKCNYIYYPEEVSQDDEELR